IGATTQDEYRNTIMKDSALARRFNDVTINEPSAADTVKILEGVKKLYEQHHHVQLPENVLKAAVDYSIQYIPQRSLPDKAIDLIDMTAAHLASKHPIVDKVELEKQIKDLNAQKDAAAKAEDFEKAANLKKEIADKQHQLEETNNEKPVVATPNDVAAAVERLTGI
ncbi:ATP-dependent Clp protease ATP-binding subunit, partial [Pseudomonas stutzeri]|nr:ATP-dependent Clp protease ATP-binding subunit [Stutzerimonas stutzeri]